MPPAHNVEVSPFLLQCVQPTGSKSRAFRHPRRPSLTYLVLLAILLAVILVLCAMVIVVAIDVRNSLEDIDCGKGLPVIYLGTTKGFLFANVSSISPQDDSLDRPAVAMPTCSLIEPGSLANATLVLKNNDRTFGHVIVNVTVALPFQFNRTTPGLPTMIGPGATMDLWLVVRVPSSTAYHDLVPTIWVD